MFDIKFMFGFIPYVEIIPMPWYVRVLVAVAFIYAVNQMLNKQNHQEHARILQAATRRKLSSRYTPPITPPRKRPYKSVGMINHKILRP
jgi:hypothetical protein